MGQRRLGANGATDGALGRDGGDCGRAARPRGCWWASTEGGRNAKQRAALRVRGDGWGTARSESAAELLCAELAADGLPVDRERAEQIIASFIGPRPDDDRDAVLQRSRRDDEVLRLAPVGMGT